MMAAAPLFDVSVYGQHELALIATVLAFDGAAYLRRYPDVARAGVDPLLHYLANGIGEGRSPWGNCGIDAGTANLPFIEQLVGFDARFYAAAYPDVTADHAQHFLDHGMREGRQPFDFLDNMAAETLTWQVLKKIGMDADGSFDRQLSISIIDSEWAIAALLAQLRPGTARPKTYRNNYWIALGLAFLVKGYFGAATVCYNNFYNHFLPLPQLGNGAQGVYAAGAWTGTLAYARQHGWQVQQLDAASTIDVADPVFLNRPGGAPASVRCALPLPHYAVLEDCMAVGGNSLLLARPHAFLYDYYAPSDDERQAEIKGPGLLHIANGHCTFKYVDTDIVLGEAFSLLHDHGHNYFHWLIEVLPRYLLARRHGLAVDAAVLIDAQIGKLQEEVVRAIVGPDVDIIKVARNSAVRVARLHWVSDLSVNTVHTLHRPEKDDILISPTALELLREVGLPWATEGVARFEQFYVIRRNVEFRRLANRSVVTAMLDAAGFWGFDPGVAAFADQVRAFSNARLIVAEAGAALANIVFCRPGATLCVLVNGYRNSNYYYIVQMAQTLGITLVFFECARIDGSHALGVHDDMVAHVSGLRAHLATLAAPGALAASAASATATTPARAALA